MAYPELVQTVETCWEVPTETAYLPLVGEPIFYYGP